MTSGLASRGVKATLIACVGTLALLALALTFDQHHQGAVWPFFRYQICALTLAALVVLAMRRLVTPRFAYLRRGSPAAPARDPGADGGGLGKLAPGWDHLWRTGSGGDAGVACYL